MDTTGKTADQILANPKTQPAPGQQVDFIPPLRVRASALQLADVVRIAANDGSGEALDGPFTFMVVKKVTDEEVRFFRPYVHTGDFSYTGGVICYLGTEEYGVCRDNASAMYLLYSRKGLK